MYLRIYDGWEGVKAERKMLNHLRFTDDIIVLASGDRVELQEILVGLCAGSEKISLKTCLKQNLLFQKLFFINVIYIENRNERIVECRHN